MENTITYWFGILPHVFYVKKGAQILLYNTQNGSYIVSSDADVIALTEEMHLKNNLGIIALTQSQLQHSIIAKFVQESKEKNICMFQEQDPDKPKPVQLMPILNLQRDVDKLKLDKSRSVGEGIMDYLTDVTVILNDDCRHSCPGCESYDKQFFHCSKTTNGQQLAADTVIRFLEDIRYTPLRRLAFTGGDILSYRQWDKLNDYFIENEIRPYIGIHYQNIIGDKVNMLKDYPIELFVTFPVNEQLFSDSFRSLNDFTVNYLFSVASEDDCNMAEKLIQEYNITHYEYRAFYNGKNLDFFENQVFLTQDDITSEPIAQRTVFAHQKLNTHFFGKIILLPNGDVKANTNGSVLGNICNEYISKILEKELSGTNFWRKIRDQKPCVDCLFQFLCPSPSNYELAIGRNNLCHVLHQ